MFNGQKPAALEKGPTWQHDIPETEKEQMSMNPIDQYYIGFERRLRENDKYPGEVLKD
jgi:hypothetical protein